MSLYLLNSFTLCTFGLFLWWNLFGVGGEILAYRFKGWAHIIKCLVFNNKGPCQLLFQLPRSHYIFLTPVIFGKEGGFFFVVSLTFPHFFPFLPIDANKVDMIHIHPLESNEKKTMKIFKFGLVFVSMSLTAFFPSKKPLFNKFYFFSQK